MKTGYAAAILVEGDDVSIKRLAFNPEAALAESTVNTITTRRCASEISRRND